MGIRKMFGKMFTSVKNFFKSKKKFEQKVTHIDVPEETKRVRPIVTHNNRKETRGRNFRTQRIGNKTIYHLA